MIILATLPSFSMVSVSEENMVRNGEMDDTVNEEQIKHIEMKKSVCCSEWSGRDVYT